MRRPYLDPARPVSHRRCRRVVDFTIRQELNPFPLALILSPSLPLLSFQFMPRSRVHGVHARQRADKEENVPARACVLSGHTMYCAGI